MKNVTNPKQRLCLAALAMIFSMGTSHSCAQETISPPLPDAQIREIATRILQKADRVNCKPRGCKILITNFTLRSGLTSQLGIQLADQFSKELASQQTGIQIIDRSMLQSFLEKERISPDLLANDKALRWLGKQLNATAVFTGITESAASDVQVLVNLLSCEKEKKGLNEVFTIPLPDSKNALSGFNPIANLASKDKWSSAPGAYRAGAAGVSLPACLYCPDPSYSNDARAAKFQGTVVLNVVVSPEGRVLSANIIRGTPFGLNEMALDTVRQWKLKPATLQGKPVAAAVPIEVSFRLLDR